MPTTFLFRVPLVAKIGKRSNGCLHWDAVEARCNNFDQIEAFKHNFGPIDGLQCHNRSLVTQSSTQIRPKLC